MHPPAGSRVDGWSGARSRTRRHLVAPLLRAACGAALCPALLGACGGGADQTIDKLQSAAAVASLIAGARIDGSVPAAYARKTFDKLAKDVSSDSAKLADDDALRDTLRGQALRGAGALRSALDSMGRSAGGDTLALARAASRADSIATVMGALAPAAKKP